MVNEEYELQRKTREQGVPSKQIIITNYYKSIFLIAFDNAALHVLKIMNVWAAGLVWVGMSIKLFTGFVRLN